MKFSKTLLEIAEMSRTEQKLDTIVSSIVSHRPTQDLLKGNGLVALEVTWEDTGRSKNSCFGPNISDMTLVLKDGAKLLPVVRKPNFSDITHDVPIENFRLCVGNEKSDREKKLVSLKDYLSNLSEYCPDAQAGLNLYNERDSVVLVSTQCCVLPLQDGKTEFTAQLFNYQSYDDNPAVLVVVVTKNGTSAQILQTANQKLFFNDAGTARYLEIERLEDVRKRRGEEKTRVSSFKEMKAEEKLDNTIMIIQVPLVVKPRSRSAKAMCLSENYDDGYDNENELCSGLEADVCADDECMRVESVKRKSRGMDMGQLGLGLEAGPFIGTKGLKLERDTRFPIRCTFQYYRVTDQPYISEKDITDIREQLAQVATVSVASGSLVVSNPEDSVDKARKTEPVLNQPKPTDSPFGKLDKRNYLYKATSSAWGSQQMAPF